MTAEDTLLNALEAAGLIHPDWQGIDHENLPRDMKEAVTNAVDAIRVDAMCPIRQIIREQIKTMELALTWSPSKLNNTSHAI